MHHPTIYILVTFQVIPLTFHENELGDYADKRFSINQCKTLNNIEMPTEEKVYLAITEIEYKIPKILNYVDKGYKIGYAGIANIPATFMLGYELGDENKKLYFH